MNEAASPPPAPKVRRKNVVSIEAPPQLDGLAALIDETPEQFVLKATVERITALQAKAKGLAITPAA